MTKLYTKQGDRGKTTICGMIVSKNHPRLSALGALDELESVLGIILARNSQLQVLEEIQSDLMEIGSAIAGMRSGVGQKLKDRTKVLEKEIDKMWQTLPPLANFIFPGGGKNGSLLHFARSICRRAERKMAILAEREKIEPSILAYLNRLSDFLFALARLVNQKESYREKIWS